MKKVGILTIVSLNLGNRLQNYALQQVLESKGFNVETILRKKENKKNKLKMYIRFLLKRDKYSSFFIFNRKIRWSKCVVSKEYTTPDIGKKYDYFVIGSDQIWNPEFKFCSELDYLPMVDKYKKLSYAASFGVSKIPKEREQEIGNLLNGLSHISVREQSGVEIVKQVANKEASLVLDPTMLLDKSEWEKIEKRPAKCATKKYLLMYILGENKFYDKIKEIAAFVYLIHHAELICTDSFHASVFSILFEKDFITFERANTDMASRITTLCDTFGLQNHFFSNYHFEYDKVRNTDYSMVNKILEAERVKGYQFLEKILLQ